MSDDEEEDYWDDDDERIESPKSSKPNSGHEMKTRKRVNVEGFDRPKPWIADAFHGRHCPICLGSTESSAMIELCRHLFCKTCLFEWLAVSDRCPLCKIRVERVLHDIKTPNEYEVHTTAKRMRGTPGDSSYSTAHEVPTLASIENAQQSGRGASFRGTDFRRAVYRRKLVAEPPESKARRPKSVDQLRTWIARELQVAAGDGSGRSDTRLVADVVEALLKENNVDDQEGFCKVKQQLQDFLFENTDSFLHELWCFRWSRLGMTAYDRDTVYSSGPT